MNKNSIGISTEWSFCNEVSSAFWKKYGMILQYLNDAKFNLSIKIESSKSNFIVRVSIEDDSEGKLSRTRKVFDALIDFDENALIRFSNVDTLKEHSKSLGELPINLWPNKSHLRLPLEISCELKTIVFNVNGKPALLFYKGNIITDEQINKLSIEVIDALPMGISILNVNSDEFLLELLSKRLATINLDDIEKRISNIEENLCVKLGILHSMKNFIIDDIIKNNQLKSKFSSELREWAVLVKYKYRGEIDEKNISILEQSVNIDAAINDFLKHKMVP